MKRFWRELHNSSPQGDNYSSLVKGPAAEAGMQTLHTTLERCYRITKIFAKLVFDFSLHGALPRLFSQKHNNISMFHIET